MVGEACLPSNAYYPRTPDYTFYSGVHVCWSEHFDPSFGYGHEFGLWLRYHDRNYYIIDPFFEGDKINLGSHLSPESVSISIKDIAKMRPKVVPLTNDFIVPI